MSIEGEPGVVRPQQHPECETCVFASRAIELAVKRYSNLAKLIEVTCRPDGSGGSHQVRPGEWVAFQGRTIRVTPGPSSPSLEEWLEGTIPVCPTYPIEGLSDEYPNLPDLKVRGIYPLVQAF